VFIFSKKFYDVIYGLFELPFFTNILWGNCILFALIVSLDMHLLHTDINNFRSMLLEILLSGYNFNSLHRNHVYILTSAHDRILKFVYVANTTCFFRLKKKFNFTFLLSANRTSFASFCFSYHLYFILCSPPRLHSSFRLPHFLVLLTLLVLGADISARAL
jgi:hypothetical protein